MLFSPKWFLGTDFVAKELKSHPNDEESPNPVTPIQITIAD